MARICRSVRISFVLEVVARRMAQRLSWHRLVVPGCRSALPHTITVYAGMAINIRFETVIAIVEDMFESLIQYGIKHIFVQWSRRKYSVAGYRTAECQSTS